MGHGHSVREKVYKRIKCKNYAFGDPLYGTVKECRCNSHHVPNPNPCTKYPHTVWNHRTGSSSCCRASWENDWNNCPWRH